MDNNFVFDGSLVDVLFMANYFAEQIHYNAIPNECFYAALFIESHTSFYNMLIQKEVDPNDILQIVIDVAINEAKISEEFDAYSLDFENGHCLHMQDDIWILLEEAKEIADSCNHTMITSNDAIFAMANLCPIPYSLISSTIIHRLTASTTLPRLEESASYTPSNESKEQIFILPDNVSGFLRVLNNDYSPEDKICPICERDEETKKLIRILLKNTKRNCVLVGEAGTGKTAICEKFVWLIVTGNCPEQFKDCIVVSLDVNSLISGTQYRGSAEQRFEDLIRFLEANPNVILFIDEIHLLLGAGACREGEVDLANALKPLLARGKTRVIGATTSQEYEKYFSTDSALKRRFEVIIVSEPRFKEVYPMIKNQIKILEDSHHVKVNASIVKQAILYSGCFNFEAKNPDKTLDLIDKAMVNAVLKGRKVVKKSDITDSFDIYTKQFHQMTLEQKKSIAYHEAGHYIVRKFSPFLSDCNMLAVSIMPAEHYLGVTVYEHDDALIPNTNINYFIASIGALLAGRIAESMFSGDLTSGASSDLQNATELAKEVVVKFGLISEFGNRVFNDRLDTIPENARKINMSVDKLLKSAEIYATSILKKNKSYLELLAENLVVKGILSEREIENLFKSINVSK